MSEFTLATTLHRPYDSTLAAVRAALVAQGFGVRAVDENATIVEAFDPDAMMGLADNDALHTVAADAKQRLTAALFNLETTEGAN